MNTPLTIKHTKVNQSVPSLATIGQISMQQNPSHYFQQGFQPSNQIFNQYSSKQQQQTNPQQQYLVPPQGTTQQQQQQYQQQQQQQQQQYQTQPPQMQQQQPGIKATQSKNETQEYMNQSNLNTVSSQENLDKLDQNLLESIQPKTTIDKIPISFPSGQSKVDKQKEAQYQYKQLLVDQINARKVQQEQERQKEKQQELQFLLQQNQYNWFGKQGCGAPLRDQYGNIISTRRNPANPNYMSQDWQFELGKQQQFQMKQNQQIDQNSKQLQNQVSIINRYAQNDGTTTTQQPALNGQNSQSQYSNQINLEKLKKKEQALQLQREQLQQIEERRRQNEVLKFEKQKLNQLEELRVQKERVYMESKMIRDQNETKIINRNLNETNYDQEQIIAKRKKQQQEQQQERLRKQLEEQERLRLLDQQAKGQEQPGEDGKRTPPNDAKRRQEEMELERERIKIEQKIIKELPVEINSQVKTTINQELMRLRNEVGYQQNTLGEQLLNIRGQIIKTNEDKSTVEEELAHLKRELKKTQWVDEIRQREIYNAFAKNDKPEIVVSNVHRLQNDENILFDLPKRPKPYFTTGDPYYDPNKAAHLKNLILNTGDQIYSYKEADKYNGKSYNDIYVDNICGISNKDGVGQIESNEYMYMGGRDQQQQQRQANRPVSPELDLGQIIKKNQDRLDHIQDINTQDKDWSIMDTALFGNAMNKEKQGNMSNQISSTNNNNIVSTHYNYLDKDDAYDNLVEDNNLG